MSRLRKALSWRYRRFVQRQGYVVMTVICAAVIAGSAAWTRQAGFRHVPDSPTPDTASVAELWQQSLREAATPSPAPTASPALWQSPLTSLTAALGFDAEKLVPSGVAGLWRVHDAVDLIAAAGERVTALRGGTVTWVADDALRVDHGDGWASEYAGLATTGDLREGQLVAAGDVVGIAGGTPHGPGSAGRLHLRVTHDGAAVDPMALLRAAESGE